MIISRKNNFIFFKPIKTAGTSVEAALSQFCDEKDILTGSLVLSELKDNRYDLSPRNNWKKSRIISGEEAREYLKKHGRIDLWKSGFKRFKIVDEIIYDEHTSPLMIDEKKLDIKKFKRFSMVRNPYDLMVSYFWWSYYSPAMDIVSYSKNIQKKILKDQRAISAPRAHDSKRDLSYKFEKFLDMPAHIDRAARPAYGDISLGEWFSEWSNEFFLADIDFHIKFENINDDFNKACAALGENPPALPVFKSNIRKISHHYRDYYTESSKNKVTILFEEAIDVFKYLF